MLKVISSRIEAQFEGKRSKKVALNVFNSSLVKVASVCVTFLLIPVSIKYVKNDVYGVWLTISSILTWITLFDFGLTNGLQNRITQAYSQNNIKLIKIYLATSYTILFSILLPLVCLFVIFSNSINWQYVLNTSVDEKILDFVINIAVIAFSLQLLFKPILALLSSLQKHYLVSFIALLSNLAGLLLILIFGDQFRNSLLFLTIVISFSPVVVLFIYSIFLFKKEMRLFSPGLKWISLSHRKVLFDLSIKFFIIQLTGLVIFASNNILIAHVQGNEAVTTYNVVYRFFSMAIVLQSLFLSPLWTGFTDAYVQGDFSWIGKAIIKLNRLCLGLCGALAIMLILSNFVYSRWIGSDFHVPFSFNLLMAMSVALSLFAANYVIFINGAGKILLQTYISVCMCLLHVPISYFFMQTLGLGLNGLVLVNIVWTSLCTSLWLFQYKKIISESTLTIWNR